MEDILVLVILAIVLLAAIIYVARAKKKGVKCVGCPYAKTCASQKAENGSCNCGCNTAENK